MDYIATIQSEIDNYRRQEEMNRVQREALERLLKKLLQETTTPVPTNNGQTILNSNQPEYRSTDAQEMSSALFSVMSDGNNWRMTDLVTAVGERLGRRVPNSTLRYVLGKEQAKIMKVGLGVYRLKKDSIDEAQERLESTDQG